MKKTLALFMSLIIVLSSTQIFGDLGCVAAGGLTITSVTPYIVAGDQAVLELTFNSPANTGGNLINMQDTDTYVQNDILIDGESVKDICSSGALDTQVWVNYVGGKMDIWILNTCTEKLKLDGTDTIVFKSGFTTPMGDAFASDSTLTYNGTTWLTEEIVNDLSISTITPFVMTGDQAVLEVTFNNPTNVGGNLLNLQDSDIYVMNDILINGKTIKDICNSGAIDTQVWINYANGGKMDIYILNTCTEKLKLDGTDTITFKSGFTIPTCHAFASDTTLTYNGTTWLTEEIVNDLGISTITPFVVDGNQAVLEVAFNNPANVGADLINIQDTDIYVQNNIYINGKSVKDICSSGAIDTQVRINYVSGKMDIWIPNTCTEKLKLDGTDTITFKSGFAIPTGHAFASDTTLTYNGTTWLTKAATNDLSISTITPFVMTGDQAVLEVTFNNPANAGSELLNIQDTDIFVQNNILINGKTIKDICNSGAIDTQVLVNYTSDGKMDIYILNTCTEKLNLDGTDTIVFKSGFTIPTGHTFASDTTLTYSGMTWLTKAVTNDLSISTITPFVMTGDQAVLEVAFNNPTNVGDNLLNLQDSDIYVKNDILINGETIKDICNSGAKDTQVLINYANGGKLDIYILNTCTEKLKLDGTDTIVFKSGFTVPTGHALASDVTLYNRGSAWNCDPVVNDQTIKTIFGGITLPNTPPYPGFQNIQISFGIPATTYGDIMFVQDSDYFVKNYILINGKTISQINAQDVIEKTDGSGTTGPAIQAHYQNGSLQLYIFANAADRLKLDGTDTITFKSGFTTPSGHSFSDDITYRYDAINQYWCTGEEKPDFQTTPIHVNNVSGLTFKPLEDNNVSFDITFDSPITYRPLSYINDPIAWLRNISAQNNPPFTYSDAELESLAEYGITGSFLDDILINGKSVRQMMKDETDLSFTPVTILVHIGQTDLSSINFTFGGGGVNKVTKDSLKNGMKLEIKPGLLTPLGGEVTEDTVYYYDYSTNSWYKDSLPKNTLLVDTGTALPFIPGVYDDSVSNNNNTTTSSSSSQQNIKSNDTTVIPTDKKIDNVVVSPDKTIRKLSPLGKLVIYGGSVMLLIIIGIALIFVLIKIKKKKPADTV